MHLLYVGGEDWRFCICMRIFYHWIHRGSYVKNLARCVHRVIHTLHEIECGDVASVQLLCIIRDIIRKEKWGTVISPQKHDLWTTYALYPDGFTPNSRKKKLWRDFFSCMNPDFFFKSFQILFYVWKKKFSGFKRILTRIFIFMCETFSFMKPDFKKGYFFIIEKNIYKFSGKSLSSCEKISGDFFFPCLEPGNTMFFLFFMYETERQKVFCIYFFHAWKRIFLFFYVWNKVKNKLYCSRPCQRGYCITVLWQHLCSVMMSCNIWDHRESGKQDSRRTALPNCEDIFSMIAFL